MRMEELVGSSLTFVGHDIEVVPPWLVSKYGPFTRHLDLSSNNLRSLKGWYLSLPKYFEIHILSQVKKSKGISFEMQYMEVVNGN